MKYLELKILQFSQPGIELLMEISLDAVNTNNNKKKIEVKLHFISSVLFLKLPINFLISRTLQTFPFSQ